MIKFVSDLRQVGCFLRVRYSGFSTIKPVCDDIAEILLKVALSDHDGLCFVLEQHNELVVYSASSL